MFLHMLFSVFVHMLFSVGCGILFCILFYMMKPDWDGEVKQAALRARGRATNTGEEAWGHTIGLCCRPSNT